MEEVKDLDESGWVEINCGGTVFATTLQTLRTDPESMLSRMFSSTGLSPAAKDGKGRLLLDRPASTFGALLNWLRTGLIEPGVDRRALLVEASFFQVQGLVDALAVPEPDFPSRGAVVQALLSQSLRVDALTGARFNGLDLSGLDVGGLSFLRCSFFSCDLSALTAPKVIFSQADFSNARLDGASLRAAAFSGCEMRNCSLNNADLSHAILQKAVLRGSSFVGANLQDAHFQDADLRDCNLKGAVLKDVHLADADLRGANLDWQALGAAPFCRGVRVTQEQYDGIDRPDKGELKLRVVDSSDSPTMLQLKKDLAAHDVVLYVLGYGSVTGGRLGEAYSNDAVRLVQSEMPASLTTKVIDIVGQSALIDDLFFLCQTRSWPKFFYKGEFQGGHAQLKLFVEALKK